MRRFLLAAMMVLLAGAEACAATVSYALTPSEPVAVDTTNGIPRIALALASGTRYASYVAASSTSTTLVFSYTVQPGDFEPTAIQVSSAVDLDNGAIRDLAGNAIVPSFTLSPGPAIKVQTYTVKFTAPVTNANATSAGLTLEKVPIGLRYRYTITSAGGSGSVDGNGTITASPQLLTGIDVSGLPSGQLTATVTLSTAVGIDGTPQTASITPSFTGVLDSLPATAAAYSLRRLSGSYSGALLRVRRASDSGETDIGATVAGNLNTAALATYCAATSCFVRSWYDQSGNGRHAVQATLASQPRLSAAGAVDALNARAAGILYSGAQSLITSFFPSGGITGFSANVVARQDSTANNFPRYISIFAQGDNDDASANSVIPLITYANPFNLSTFRNGSNYTAHTLTVGTPFVGSSVHDATSRTVYRNGASATNAFANAPLGSQIQIWLGAGRHVSVFLTGIISEAIWAHTTWSTTQRRTLEQDQAGYYGISVL